MIRKSVFTLYTAYSVHSILVDCVLYIVHSVLCTVRHVASHSKRGGGVRVGGWRGRASLKDFSHFIEN